jgi:hypothetical protein
LKLRPVDATRPRALRGTVLALNASHAVAIELPA